LDLEVIRKTQEDACQDGVISPHVLPELNIGGTGQEMDGKQDRYAGQHFGHTEMGKLEYLVLEHGDQDEYSHESMVLEVPAYDKKSQQNQDQDMQPGCQEACAKEKVSN